MHSADHNMRAFLFATAAILLWPIFSGWALAQPAPAPAPASIVLTDVSQVRSLTPAEAAKSLPVHLTGIMIDSADGTPHPRSMILQDATAAIYVRSPQPLPCHVGDVLDVVGVTDPGQFAPIVVAKTISKFGTNGIPAAEPVTYQQLITGALDAQWVEIKGVVRLCYNPATNSDIWRILVAMDGGVVPVRYTTQSAGYIAEDTEVQVRAIVFYQFNQKRQPLHPILQVPRGEPLVIEKPAPSDPYAAPVRTALSLSMFTPENLRAYAHRVHVSGIVTCFQPGKNVWIRDLTSGLRIQTGQQKYLKPGDRIEALGFPTFSSFSPVLEDSVWQKSGSAPPPEPLALTNFNSVFEHEDDLVAVAGNLTQIQPVLNGFTLTLEKEGKTFKAFISLPPDLPPDWEAGSRVRITGICSLVYDDTRPYAGMSQPKSFQILLRSPADLTVIKPPSWWTLRHVTLLLGVITALLVLTFSLFVVSSRRRLAEQERHREMAETEFAAILSERNRLAREIHDTLAQGLAATSVHLRLAKKYSDGSSEAVARHIDTAQSLVRHSLEEARSSIWNMRAHVLETANLAGALRDILKQLSEGTDITTSFEATGRLRRLAPVIENNALRVGQEAIANTIKHSGATRIQVALAFGEDQFTLRVTDDGCGFNSQTPPPSEGGFGLMGMRERAVELKGELIIRSAPGQGAEITLNVPLSGE